jgi:hypothetical protein
VHFILKLIVKVPKISAVTRVTLLEIKHMGYKYADNEYIEKVSKQKQNR